jgi:hypothetical protein
MVSLLALVQVSDSMKLQDLVAGLRDARCIWMVCLLENPNLKWMITVGNSHFRKPPDEYVILCNIV